MTRETAKNLMEDIYEIENKIRNYASERCDYENIAYELSEVREQLDQAVSDFESEMEIYGPRVEAALKKYSASDIIGAIYYLEINYVIEADTKEALFKIADPKEKYLFEKDGYDYMQESDWYNNGEKNPLLK